MRRVVMVMSAGHSGSTLLDLILGSHSGGFSLGELGSLPRRMKAGELPSRVCGICEESCELWDRPELRQFLRRHFRWATSRVSLLRSIDARLGAARSDLYGRLFRATEAEYLVDSGKRIAWFLRQLRPAWHWRDRKPHLVFLHRDGRAVINSLLRKYPERGARALSEQWARTVRSMEELFAGFPADRRSRISYESLATATGETIERLCGEIGISYQPAMLPYWRHHHHIVHGNAGTRSLIHRFRRGDEAAADRPEFYRELGLGIQLDTRWQSELADEDLHTFEATVGELNEGYRYETVNGP